MLFSYPLISRNHVKKKLCNNVYDDCEYSSSRLIVEEQVLIYVNKPYLHLDKKKTDARSYIILYLSNHC